MNEVRANTVSHKAGREFDDERLVQPGHQSANRANRRPGSMHETELRLLLPGVIADAKNVWAIAGLGSRATKRPDVGRSAAKNRGRIFPSDYY